MSQADRKLHKITGIFFVQSVPCFFRQTYFSMAEMKLWDKVLIAVLEWVRMSVQITLMEGSL